jgi:hypothetical protein
MSQSPLITRPGEKQSKAEASRALTQSRYGESVCNSPIHSLYRSFPISRFAKDSRGSCDRHPALLHAQLEAKKPRLRPGLLLARMDDILERH